MRIICAIKRLMLYFFVDYGKKLELPVFKHKQPGPSYYYSPMSMYNLGMVNHAQIVIDNRVGPKEHMHDHVYHEGVVKKGAKMLFH